MTMAVTKPVVPSDQNTTGRSFGKDELEFLKQALDSGTLIAQGGTITKRLEQEWARWLGVEHCVAVSSGTAALHCAIAAVRLRPGDEIITTPITDMGAVMPMIYEGAIPVFADVDPRTCNVTAETIADQITDRTRAIMVTHLFGNPVDVDPVLELARKRNIVVIEDAAQAIGATYKGRKVGTIGDIGCFSLQQGKHITCGEGGFVVTNNPDYGRYTRLYHDKGWGFNDKPPDHSFLALNYRMTELQAAVTLGQFQRVDQFVQRRRDMARQLTERITGIPGLVLPKDPPWGTHVYWRYCLRLEEPMGADDLDRMSNALREIGARTAPRYTQKLGFEYGFLKNYQANFGGSGWPFIGPQRDQKRDLKYDRKFYPGGVAALDRLLCIGWSEKYDPEIIELIAGTIKQAAKA